MEDSQLIDRLKQKEEAAYRFLVEKYKVNVYNTCLGFLKNEEEADDASQEVFIEVFESISAFRGESQLSTWIYRIAVNKSFEILRKKKQKKRKAYLYSLFGMDSHIQLKADDFYHPGLQLENKERGAILFRKIDELPDKQRIAFTLHKLEGLNYATIAEVMGTSLSSVESLMFRAKKNLQKSLRAYYEAENNE